MTTPKPISDEDLAALHEKFFDRTKGQEPYATGWLEYSELQSLIARIEAQQALCVQRESEIESAENEIEALQAEIERLREGLRKAPQAGDFQRVMAAYTAVRRAALKQEVS